MKTIGGSLIGLTGAIGTASATGKPEYVGLTYDPVTHEVLGNASGNLVETPKGLSGSLKIGEKTVSFNEQPSFVENLRNTESGPKSRRRYINKIPLADEPSQHSSVKVSSTENAGMTGFIRPPREEKVAFAIGRKETNPATEIKEILEATKPKNTGRTK